MAEGQAEKMNKVISNNTIFPTKIIKGDYHSEPIIYDYMKLKPRGDKDVLLILK